MPGQPSASVQLAHVGQATSSIAALGLRSFATSYAASGRHREPPAGACAASLKTDPNVESSSSFGVMRRPRVPSSATYGDVSLWSDDELLVANSRGDKWVTVHGMSPGTRRCKSSASVGGRQGPIGNQLDVNSLLRPRYIIHELHHL